MGLMQNKLIFIYSGENRMHNNKNDENHKYLAYCIPAGLLIGTAIAVVASLNIGICAGVGMLLGVVIGTIIDSLE